MGLRKILWNFGDVCLSSPYAVNKAGKVSTSLAYAPEVKQTNSNTGLTSIHSQTNLQLMYSYEF